jgi:hypothetical protein
MWLGSAFFATWRDCAVVLAMLAAELCWVGFLVFFLFI